MDRKSNNFIEKTIQGIATVILFILILYMMHYVNDIQGTARVVNYTGLVRGATQRVVKLECAGIESKHKIAELDEYVDGVQNGSSNLELVKIEDSEYQAKAAELSRAWIDLKREIELVRQFGAPATNIIPLSESYFILADDVVDEAERYSQTCALAISHIEIGIDLLILLLGSMMLKQSIAAIKLMRMNRELRKKVYWDEYTELPNKNECERILNDAALIDTPTTCFMFDLNNLKYVNDSLGHEAGDELIYNFARFIRQSVPEQFFVGRYGGDEFIVIFPTVAKTVIQEFVDTVRQKINVFNKAADGVPISYAVGYAGSDDFEECTLRVLLSRADKNMYINKKLTKQVTFEVEKQVDKGLMHMIEALGRGYMDCCYCNVKLNNYRLFKKSGLGILPDKGKYTEVVNQLVEKYVCSENQDTVRNLFSLENIAVRLNQKAASFSEICHCNFNGVEKWWRTTAMFVDNDDNGRLHHFIVLFEEITSEMHLEYNAKHDGLTGLLNKTTAIEMIDYLISTNPECTKSMLVVDLDNFKLVNDYYGHSEGDYVIAEAASMIRAEFRQGDIIARFGGDEYMVFVNGSLNSAKLKLKAQSIVDKIRTRFGEKYSSAGITASVGIVSVCEAVDFAALFREADKALYEAKKCGKNSYAIHEEISE